MLMPSCVGCVCHTSCLIHRIPLPCADDSAEMTASMPVMVPYATISQRLRRTANRHRYCWKGLLAFKETTAHGVVQTREFKTGANLARLVRRFNVARETSASLLVRRYGIHRGYGPRTQYMFWSLRRSMEGIPLVFQSNNIRFLPLLPRAIHECTLIIAAAGMKHPVLEQIWSLYPRYGIPIGLRRDGTLILYIGAPGLEFASQRLRRYRFIRSGQARRGER